MEYKGYKAETHYEHDGGYFYGKIAGISDFILFDAETLPELEQVFHESVDAYLYNCEQLGIKPKVSQLEGAGMHIDKNNIDALESTTSHRIKYWNGDMP